MLRVEVLLAQFGIEVTGYARSQAPQVEWVASEHPYVQGNDGGYAGGRIFINNQSTAECEGLTLVHELVHDATAKQRLFATVANDQVRDMFETLADAITETAAQDPYLPGCLPRRRFAIDRDRLVSLATDRAPVEVAASLTQASESVAALDKPLAELAPPATSEIAAEGLAMFRCRGLPGDPCIALLPPL